MPFRITEFTAKVQFITSAEMPNLVYKACLVTNMPSNTVYIQHAVAEALSRDLNIPLEQLIAHLPPPRGRATRPLDRSSRPGSSTNEDVR